MTRRLFFVTLMAVVMTLAVQGCVAAKKPTGPKATTLISAADAQKLGYVSRWVVDLNVDPQAELRHTVVLDDVLVTTEVPTNLVTVVSVRDGSFLWRRVVGDYKDDLYLPSRIKDKLILNNTHRFFLFGVKTGQPLSMSDMETPVNGGPAVVNNLAVYGGLNGVVFAHNTVTGYSAWRNQLPGSIFVPPVAQGGSVFAADTLGNYALYDTEGTRVWGGRAHARISAEPVLTSNGVFVASEDQSLYALNRANGKDRWVYRAAAPLKRGPVVLGASIYLPLPAGGLVSIDPLNGSELWKFEASARPLALQDQKLILATTDRLIIADNQTGKVVAEAPLAGVRKVIYTSDKSLILVSSFGIIQRLDPK